MRPGYIIAAALLAVPVAAQAQTAPNGKVAFAACMACHGTKPTDKRMGPTMAGIVGRKAGSVNGYAYSPAMAKSGIVWNEAKLDAYMANPKGVVPGTKMAFGGVPQPEKRKAIIAYLKTLPAK
jgi:cytochrome c